MNIQQVRTARRECKPHERFERAYTVGMPNASEYFWFLDTLVCVRVSHRSGADRISVLEHTARRGDSPPLHVHVNEDEVFHILDGDFRFQIGSEQRKGQAGDTVLAAKGVPHTYRVESDTGRWLTVTTHEQFEEFVRAMARKAQTDELPPVGGPPSAEAIEALTAVAKKFGIAIVGPPMQ
jgi:quercetin dioxygenase-like cupin family protein